MPRFRSNLLTKSVGSVGQSFRFASPRAAMASARGLEIAKGNDPWRVSAFISALMELFLSVLLLLGATIAFITSQLVNYFGLEAPCTYIGCSHTLYPTSRRDHRLDHAKQDLLYELCPDCRTSWGYKKRCNQKFLLNKDDTDMSLFPEGDDISLNDSSISTSDVDVPHLDEATSVSSDPHSIRSSFSSSTSRNCKKPIKLKHVKPRASNFSGRGSQSFNNDSCSISSAEEYCEATSQTSCTVPHCQVKIYEKEIIADDETSVQSLEAIPKGHHDQDHYMLLEDEDEEVYQDPSFVSLEATSDSDNVHRYMALEDEYDSFEGGQLHPEIAQPLLRCVPEARLEAEGPFPLSPFINKVANIDIDIGSHGPFTIQPAECSNQDAFVEDVKKPTCTYACEGEHHYMLLEGDDEETRQAPFLKELQPLLNDASDDEHELPSFKRVPNMVDIFNKYPSSCIRQATQDRSHHEPTQSGVLTTAFEEEHHQYTLLGVEDEDFSEALDLKDVLYDCVQPLLQTVREDQSEGQRLSLRSEAAKLLANVDDSYEAVIERPAEDSAHCESPRFSCESMNVKAFMKPVQMQNRDSLLQGFAADQIDTSTPQGSRHLKPPSCDEAIVKDDMKSKNYIDMDLLNAPLAGQSKEQETQVSLIDMDSSCMDFSDLVEVGNIYKLKSFGSGPQIAVVKEATLCGMIHTQLTEQGSSTSDLKELCNKDQYMSPGFQQQAVDESNFYSSRVSLVHDVHLFQMESQLEEFESSPVACFVNTDGNKVAVAAEGCFLELDNAKEIDDMGNAKSTMNVPFETIFKKAVVQLDIGKEGPRSENMDAQQANVEGVENVLDVVSQVAEQDRVEMQVEEAPVEGFDALREALVAERKLHTALEAELENERNAAAIATSEAMAMISRLQEEKSAMQLEVAQLQRMAEEKAEYDEQAMELLKEILFKRETEKHALEKEVELYRQRLLAEKGENISRESSTPLLLPSRTDEDKAPLSPKRQNENLRNLPLFDEPYKSENAFSSEYQQIVAQGQHTARSPQCAKLPELSLSEGLYAIDQVDDCFAEDKGTYASPISKHLSKLHHTHHDLRGRSKSVFSTNDEETQFILERLWVLEGELRELRGIDGLGEQKKLLDGQNMDSSLLGGKTAGKIFDAHNDRVTDGQAIENGVGACLPLHDVYEVQSVPMQQSRDIKQGSLLLNDNEILGGSRPSSRDIEHEELVPIMHCQSSHIISPLGRQLPIIETQCDSPFVASQVETYADSRHGQLLKATEGGLVSIDVVQQLAVRLQVLERDRDLLREILESFRHRHAELKLLQEIAQQLRELRMVGFCSIPAGVPADGVLQGPMSATFGKSCTRAFKKRRYCSESGQGDLVLLHQRSI